MIFYAEPTAKPGDLPSPQWNSADWAREPLRWGHAGPPDDKSLQAMERWYQDFFVGTWHDDHRIKDTYWKGLSTLGPYWIVSEGGL